MSLEQPWKIPSQRSQKGNSLQAGAELVTVSWSLFFSGMMNGVGSPSSRNSPSPIPRPWGIKRAFSRGSSTPWMFPEEPREEQGLRCLHRPRGPGVLWMTSCGHSWRKSSGWQAGRRKKPWNFPPGSAPNPSLCLDGAELQHQPQPGAFGINPALIPGISDAVPEPGHIPIPIPGADSAEVSRYPEFPNSRCPGEAAVFN